MDGSRTRAPAPPKGRRTRLLLPLLAVALAGCPEDEDTAEDADRDAPWAVTEVDPLSEDEVEALLPDEVHVRPYHGQGVHVGWESGPWPSRFPESNAPYGYHVYIGDEPGIDPEMPGTYFAGTRQFKEDPIVDELEYRLSPRAFVDAVEGPGSVPERLYVRIAVLASNEQHPAEEVSVDLVEPRLNGTGVSWCAVDHLNELECPLSTHPWQDGDAGVSFLAHHQVLKKQGDGAEGFDFTPVSNSGGRLADNAWIGDGQDEWNCILDERTGLLWEIKRDSSPHLRHRGHVYTWLQSDGEHGGEEGEADGGVCAEIECDTESYVEAVNDQGMCGHTDWRVPTVVELDSLLHLGAAGAKLDTDYFPRAVGTTYWSADTFAGDPSTAWRVDFSDGEVVRLTKDSPAALRLVTEYGPE